MKTVLSVYTLLIHSIHLSDSTQVAGEKPFSPHTRYVDREVVHFS